jgi:hypothetical protein
VLLQTGSPLAEALETVPLLYENVSDVGTLGLIAEFYSQLQTAPTTAIALQEAQQAMIDEEVFVEEGALVWSDGTMELSFPTDNIPK